MPMPYQVTSGQTQPTVVKPVVVRSIETTPTEGVSATKTALPPRPKLDLRPRIALNEVKRKGEVGEGAMTASQAKMVQTFMGIVHYRNTEKSRALLSLFRWNISTAMKHFYDHEGNVDQILTEYEHWGNARTPTHTGKNFSEKNTGGKVSRESSFDPNSPI